MTNLSLILLFLNVCLTGILCLAIYQRYIERRKIIKSIHIMLHERFVTIEGEANGVIGSVKKELEPGVKEPSEDIWDFIESDILTIIGMQLLPELSKDHKKLDLYLSLSSAIHAANYLIIVRRLHRILLPLDQQNAERFRQNSFRLMRLCESVVKMSEVLHDYLIPDGSLAK